MTDAIRKHRQLFDDQKRNQHDIPPDTCPRIDRVKDDIGDAIMSLIEDKNKESAVEYALECLEGLDVLLEEIRTANHTLRDLGRDWYKFSRDMLNDLERHKAQKEAA
jgi:hypothetical protein